MLKVYIVILTSLLINADYWDGRNKFINSEESMMLGASIILTDKEIAANKIIMKFKTAEYEAGIENPLNYLPAQHFIHARKKIENSTVFKLIQKLPKGAMLHGHLTALASDEYIFNLTYTDNLYACEVNKRLKLQFFKKPIKDTSCDWQLLKDLRKTKLNYDKWVRSQLTMIVDNPKEVYTDAKTVWSAFQSLFESLKPLLTYIPVFKQHLYQVLQELYDDNVMYAEIRTVVPKLYDLAGTKYSPRNVLRLYKETLDLFMKNNPGFFGAKIIYTIFRKLNKTMIENEIQIATELKNEFPDLIVGIDFVGQEDLGRPLTDFVNQLASNDLKFFFHAGETNWYGTPSDTNLVDAVLMNTTRIGHGYALTKHPKVLEYVKANGIGIEVSPISNQVLLLVNDMRNHPASFFIANNFPVVICNDDPSFWGAKGLSYDWYEVFMGIASLKADIKVLKQLALNSLLYSSLDSLSKNIALDLWNLKWVTFLDYILDSHY